MKNVVAAYDRNNFDTNQDLPGFITFLPRGKPITGNLGNVFWEEMYEELGGKD